ncbi:hypothetical protein CYLTODRAFT_460497 [Cylindrobasidium torrendii FP15055 ss-10]|uniref:Uncharacterized protein n=1 Tax=Cylindrobasidium torrendii FP15055 ss-10 TaxID=1314674 RepID=A0A0D7AR82_9AGAR|nr:hypothetical protein CYLTODRAFT_460497 [Cylindrobasidium torrendii FP15055 ss-10]
MDDFRIVLSHEPYPYGTARWPIVNAPGPAPLILPSSGGAEGLSIPLPGGVSEDVDMGDDHHPLKLL